MLFCSFVAFSALRKVKALLLPLNCAYLSYNVKIHLGTFPRERISARKPQPGDTERGRSSNEYAFARDGSDGIFYSDVLYGTICRLTPLKCHGESSGV